MAKKKVTVMIRNNTGIISRNRLAMKRSMDGSVQGLSFAGSSQMYL